MSESLQPEFLQGVKGFPNTFFSERDSQYLDRLTLDMIKIRGQNFYYYKKLDVPARTDGDRPISNSLEVLTNPFAVKGHSGSEIAALYGEPIQVNEEVDTIIKNVAPDWNYAPPIEHRGVVFQPQQTDIPDERGHIENHKITLNMSRALCEMANLVPEIGDIVKLTDLLDGYYDVQAVERDSHRFGGYFYTVYQLSMSKSSKYEPQRKNLPDKSL